MSQDPAIGGSEKRIGVGTARGSCRHPAFKQLIVFANQRVQAALRKTTR